MSVASLTGSRSALCLHGRLHQQCSASPCTLQRGKILVDRSRWPEDPSLRKRLPDTHEAGAQQRLRSPRAARNIDERAPQNPLLRTRHSREPVWPGASGGRHSIVNVHLKVHRTCRLVRRSAVAVACSAARAPPPQPWPYSVPVGRCGAASRPGPERRSDVRGEGTVRVAPAAFGRH